MSLRFRLVVLIALALLLSLVLGGAIACLNASRSVQTEMRSALLVGRQTVDNAIREIGGSTDPQRDLQALVASFKGNRHLRVSVVGDASPATVLPVGERMPFGKVPKWFIRLIGVPSETERVSVEMGGLPLGTVIIETDPRNEILEVWNELSGGFVVLALFCVLTIPVIYLVIGGALRPLGRLSAAMAQVGEGDYAIRVGERLTPELARLRDSFNRMASRLAATDADNRRLNEQLLTVQEEERGDIARDLHDEVGPFLFAINVDVAAMSRLVEERRLPELSEPLQSIAEAARHLQRQVRGMLNRLRPIGLAEFGLAEAVDSLVGFWRRRYPEIDYRVEMSEACANLGGLVDTTVYRIVQECLSNAVRHGKPRQVTISVERAGRGDEVLVEVADDGAGMREPPGTGYGLIGMAERVRALGGRLTYSNRPGGGFAVSATLPQSHRLPSPLPEAAR